MEETRLVTWGWTRLEQLARDVGYGLRQVRRNPAFSAIAIATLALGIGVNTAMFSAVDAVLIRPLPYADAGRLVMIWDEMSRIGFPKYFSTPAEWHEWRRHNTVFTDIAATQPGRRDALRATASPKNCRPAKSPPISGPSLAHSRCSDASSRKTKTRAACAWWSSAMDCGSGASAGRPTWWAARSL